MKVKVKEIILSTVLVTVTLYALWPVGTGSLDWWNMVPAALQGDGLVLVVLFGGSVAVGVGTLKVTRIQLVNLAIGGCVAFTFLMVIIGVILAPDSSAHWILYGAVLIGIITGAFAQWKLSGKQKRISKQNSP